MTWRVPCQSSAPGQERARELIFGADTSSKTTPAVFRALLVAGGDDASRALAWAMHEIDAQISTTEHCQSFGDAVELLQHGLVRLEAACESLAGPRRRTTLFFALYSWVGRWPARARRTVTERIEAKAAELAASGYPVSGRTVPAAGSWRDQGLWGLVDGRATRFRIPGGPLRRAAGPGSDRGHGRPGAHVDRDRARVMRQAERLLVERYGEGVVPVPARASFYRLLNVWPRAGTSSAPPRAAVPGQAAEAPFTPTIAARPGEVVQIDTTPLDVLAIWTTG